MKEEDFERMTGVELGAILDLNACCEALQQALDAAGSADANSDWAAVALAVLTPLCADPWRRIEDATGRGPDFTDTRVSILADELMRAHFEEG